MPTGELETINSENPEMNYNSHICSSLNKNDKCCMLCIYVNKLGSWVMKGKKRERRQEETERFMRILVKI